jgi:hypothetical protein
MVEFLFLNTKAKPLKFKGKQIVAGVVKRRGLKRIHLFLRS